MLSVDDRQGGKARRTLRHLSDERLRAHELAAREDLAVAEGEGEDEAVAVKGVADALLAVVKVAGAVAQQRALEVRGDRALQMRRLSALSGLAARAG